MSIDSIIEVFYQVNKMV